MWSFPSPLGKLLIYLVVVWCYSDSQLILNATLRMLLFCRLKCLCQKAARRSQNPVKERRNKEVNV